MKVVIYVSNHCHSCQEVIQYFEAKGISPDLINVTNDQTRFDEMLELGGIATPFIRIGEQPIHSFNRSKIDLLLEENL